jgi:hypothetical protein
MNLAEGVLRVLRAFYDTVFITHDLATHTKKKLSRPHTWTLRAASDAIIFQATLPALLLMLLGSDFLDSERDGERENAVTCMQNNMDPRA